jgi:integrase
VKGSHHEAMLVTAVATGLRQGELLGLRWSDVDLAAGSVTVRHPLQWIDGQPTLVETKTAKSRRTIPLPQVARDALSELWSQRAAGAVSSPFLFTGTAGQPLRHTVALRALEAALRDAGLPRVTFHALRHTAASLLLAQGVHPRVVMELLGHSTIALTMNTYSHVIPALEREAAERMDALLAN